MDAIKTTDASGGGEPKSLKEIEIEIGHYARTCQDGHTAVTVFRLREWQHGIAAALASAPPAPTPEAGSDLAGLSEKATQGEAHAAMDSFKLRVGPPGSTFENGFTTVAVCSTCDQAHANLIYLAALWNAHRSGRLVEASPSPPPGEDLAGQGASLDDIDPHEEAENYEYRIDGDYTPTDFERGMLEDFATGLLEKVRGLIEAPAPDLAGQGEPVAWAWEEEYASGWRRHASVKHPGVRVGARNVRPLGFLDAAPAPSRPADREEIDLRAKAKALLDRLDTIHADPAYINVWAVSQLHAGPYRGPTYVAEADALRAALRDAPRDGGDGTNPDLITGEPQPVRVDYINWRGERLIRRILPNRLVYGATEWHPRHQWLVEAFDLDKGQMRLFAWEDMQMLAPTHPDREGKGGDR